MLKTTQGLSNVNGAIQTGMGFSPYFSKKHTDSNTLLSAFNGDGSNTMYLGMLKLWSQYKMLSAPLISMTELEGNTLYTNGFGSLLGFTIPYNVGLPKIKENLCGDQVKPGIGGAVFPIVLTEDCFTNGDVITYDYRNGKQLRIEEDEIVPYGSGWKYMVKVATMNELDDYFPPQALEPGTQFMKISNYSGEYDQNTSTLSNMTRTGLMNFSYQTGSAEMSIGHWVTSYGDMLEVTDAQKNPNLLWLQNYSNLNDNKGLINFFNYTKDGSGKVVPIAGSTSWMPSIIAAMQIELATMKERALMWGQGMEIGGSGRAKTRVASGYYQQVKNRGNYITYSSTNQLPNILKNIVGQLFANRTDIAFKDRRVKFRMGMGAMIAMQQEFMTQFKSGNPFTIFNADPILKGMLSGTYDDLAYKPIRVTSLQYPEVGVVEIEHDPVLDFIDVENEIVPYNGQYPNSSYMVFVEDLTNQDFSNAMPKSGTYNVDSGFNNGANVMMLKPKNYVDTMGFEIGIGCNPTLKQFTGWNANGYVHSSKNKGFGVTMLTAGEVWIKDPSRVVMVELVPDSGFLL